MPGIFTPLTIKDAELKNRLVVSPMCQYSSIDGFMNDWHLVHLGSRAVGGAALVFTEATAVSPEGRISPADAGIWKDAHIKALQQIVAYIHSVKALAGIQLAHAGRKASCAVPWEGGRQISIGKGGWQTVGPSEKPFHPDDRVPEALDRTGIMQIVGKFREATTRALQAGFDVIEIHGAHGYLLHEFLSPNSNFRTDEYGGSFENRIRLLIEVVDAAREVWPVNKPLFVRLSVTEWSETGFSPDDAVQLAGVLKEHGVDLIDCSSGGNIKTSIPVSPGYQVHLAEKLKKTGILTAAVGIITTTELANRVISEGSADLVFMAREMLRNPYFPLLAAREMGIDIEWPVQYLRSKNF